nr:AMP-binding protein [Gordonia sp. LAM0048]
MLGVCGGWWWIVVRGWVFRVLGVRGCWVGWYRVWGRCRVVRVCTRLFTSGSTGRPKGVTVSQAAVVNRLGWMQSLFGLEQRDVVLWKTPVSFDVSVWELFWPLMVGASVVVAEPGGHRDPWYVASVVERFGVSVCHFVPSMLSVFVDALRDSGVGGSGRRGVAGLGSLREVFCSGEAFGCGCGGGFAGVGAVGAGGEFVWAD